MKTLKHLFLVTMIAAVALLPLGCANFKLARDPRPALQYELAHKPSLESQGGTTE